MNLKVCDGAREVDGEEENLCQEGAIGELALCSPRAPALPHSPCLIGSSCFQNEMNCKACSKAAI